ncbi:MAG: protein translocase subunit SecD [Anaerolineae bacterium]|nr:protein translocase subunit SecD [Anaerolineae bacterium]
MSRQIANFFLILILVALSIWVNTPAHPTIDIGGFQRSMDLVLGLDLQGGMQVILEAKENTNSPVTEDQLNTAIKILENRSNGLGVSEVAFQRAGQNRVVGEFPGLTNTDEVLAVLKETGQLEFVDMGTTPLSDGTVIITDHDNPQPAAAATPEVTPAADAAAATPTVDELKAKVWHSIMTGDQINTVTVSRLSNSNKIVVNFELKDEGAKIFKDYTENNIGKYLAIVLDKKIISAPVINSAIPEGKGYIEGKFTQETANNLAVQLRYGSLPVAFDVVNSSVVGPTLGQDSIRKSVIAGLIGMIVIMLFMIIYYRLPGFVASLALATYALLSLALFRFIPVTLTMPGIAGFVLSIGMAVDANILIFERMKEELRAGRTLTNAIDLGWRRAWLSIRDSNISTLITCAILFWFGSNFGASIVKGFAFTLALGVIVSLFTAVVVTRTFLHVVLDQIKFSEHPKWFGA